MYVLLLVFPEVISQMGNVHILTMTSIYMNRSVYNNIENATN